MVLVLGVIVSHDHGGDDEPMDIYKHKRRVSKGATKEDMNTLR